jgi:hypothetical protein
MDRIRRRTHVQTSLARLIEDQTAGVRSVLPKREDLGHQPIVGSLASLLAGEDAGIHPILGGARPLAAKDRPGP